MTLVLLASACADCPEFDTRLPPAMSGQYITPTWSIDPEDPGIELRGDVGQLTYHDSQNGDVVIRFRVKPNW